MALKLKTLESLVLMLIKLKAQASFFNSYTKIFCRRH